MAMRRLDGIRETQQGAFNRPVPAGVRMTLGQFMNIEQIYEIEQWVNGSVAEVVARNAARTSAGT